MRGLALRTPARISRHSLLLGLLVWSVLSQLNTVPTNAATTHYAHRRKMRDTAELEGTRAIRFRELITHEEFSLRNLLQVDKKKIDNYEDVGQEEIAQSEDYKEQKKSEQKTVVEETQLSKLDLKEPDRSVDEFQLEQNAVVHIDQEKIGENEEQIEADSSKNLKPVHSKNAEEHLQQHREVDGETEEENESREEQQPQKPTVIEEEKMDKNHEPQSNNREQKISEDSEKTNVEENQEPKTEEWQHKQRDEDRTPVEEKNSTQEEEKNRDKPFVFPEPYLLGPTIKDWDIQRESWLNANPEMKTTLDGKPRVLIVTGSQPQPCGTSLGDNFHIKSFKLKIDYARMHNYEIYYNLAWLDPLFGGFWAKLPTIRALVLAHPEIEWFFWVDSDAIFTDMLFEAPWETYEGYNMIMWGGNDYFYAEKHWTGFNDGVFFLRNCQWTLDLIDKWSPMGPEGPVRVAYGQILSSVLTGRNDWPADDQSALAYLMITDEAVKAKVKLVDSPEYMISGWWVPIVDTFEELMEKYHPGLGNHRWPWITHFTGCGPCLHSDDDTPESRTCMKNIERALHFGDNQVLAYMGFEHQSLSSSEVIRSRNETDQPLELLGVNPWEERIAELAAVGTL